MIVTFYSATPGEHYRYEIDMVTGSKRIGVLYFWNTGKSHYRISLNVDNGRVLEYPDNQSLDCPQEYHVIGWRIA